MTSSLWQWTPVRLEKLADVLIGLGHIMFGSIAIPFFFDEFAPLPAVSGLMLALAFWAASLIVVKEEL